jgi:hypothetical protein
MRFNYLLPASLLACICVACGLGGCTTKTDIAPEQPCGTFATVRFCHGYTMDCLTKHTTLELADGTRLRPSGPVWEAYLPQQSDGQPLRIGYTLGAELPSSEVGDRAAKLSCLEAVGFCGTVTPCIL